jgi:hypothetical protein
VRAELLVLLRPGLRRLPCFMKRLKEPPVEAAVSEHGVEALVVTVPPGTAGLDEPGRDAAVPDPVLDPLHRTGNRDTDARNLDQAIDTGTATGKLLFHVLGAIGAIGEFERTLIVERTKADTAFPGRNLRERK